MKLITKLVLSLAIGSSLAARAEANYAIQPLYAGLKKEKPLLLTTSAKGERFLAQQTGQVFLLPKDEAATTATLFLDLSSRKLEVDKQSSFEEGLVGFALHPKFSENGKFYVYYTQQDPKHAVLSEFTAKLGDVPTVEVASEKVLLKIPLPHWNHHSGNLIFGKDGLLYIGVGDGGGPQGGDQHRFAQNTFALLGKILRIDVDSTSGNRPYGLPAGNPWINKAGYYPETIALGVRNPWGMSFDADGTLWFADVGQNLYEEVNLLEIGGNYGWNYREGTTNFAGNKEAAPQAASFVEPIHTYSRDEGISITGGVLYTGKALPALAGAYVYGDWGSGRVWALRYDKAGKKKVSNDLLIKHNPSGKGSAIKPTGIYQDEAGEVIILDWQGGIFRLTAGS